MPIKEVIAAYMQSVYLDVFLHVLSLLFPQVRPCYLWPVAISQDCLLSEILQPLNLRNCYPRLLRMEEAREVLGRTTAFNTSAVTATRVIVLYHLIHQGHICHVKTNFEGRTIISQYFVNYVGQNYSLCCRIVQLFLIYSNAYSFF